MGIVIRGSLATIVLLHSLTFDLTGETTFIKELEKKLQLPVDLMALINIPFRY